MCEPVTSFLTAVGTSLGATGTAATVTGAAVVGTTVSLGLQYQGYQASKDAAKTQQAMENLRAQRSQVQALREAQIKRAMLVQRSAGSGTMDSSGFAGGMSSLSSQLGGNQMFANQMGSMASSIGRYNSRAQTYGALSGLVNQVTGFALSPVGSDFLNSFGGTTNTVSATQLGNNTSR
jgi:hypothetical protein